MELHTLTFLPPMQDREYTGALLYHTGHQFFPTERASESRRTATAAVAMLEVHSHTGTRSQVNAWAVQSI